MVARRVCNRWLYLSKNLGSAIGSLIPSPVEFQEEAMDGVGFVLMGDKAPPIARNRSEVECA